MQISTDSPRSTQQRQCAGCTACCDGWVRINIHGHSVYPGRPCPHSTGHSCAIYERRPEHPCRHFTCGWKEPGSLLPEEFRPDIIKLIYVPMTWRGKRAYVLTPAGADPTPELLDWIRQHAQQTACPIVYQHTGEWYALGPPEFQNEMAEKISRNEELWD